MKKFISVIAFVLLFSVIFSYTQTLFSRKATVGWWNTTAKIDGFYNSPKNEYDVVFFGSSNAFCSFNPLIIWKESGVKSYVFATQQQPVWATYHYMVDAFKTQKPDLAVVDILMFCKDKEFYDDDVNYTFCDNMPFSLNKVKLAYASAPKGERIGLLCNFVKYHSRWNDLNDLDFKYKKSEMRDYTKGFCILTGAYDNPVLREDVSKVKELTPLPPKNEKYLKKIIDLCEEEDIRLMFVKTPSNATREEKMYYNSVEKVALERGIEYIDYNPLYEEIGLDMKTDFCDESHLNTSGSEKFSKYFVENVDVFAGKSAQDDSWEEDYQKYLEETDKK